MCDSGMTGCMTYILIDGDLRYVWTDFSDRQFVKVHFRVQRTAKMNRSDPGFNFKVAFVD